MSYYERYLARRDILPRDVAERVAFAIMADVTGRRGWGAPWDGFEDDTKSMIIATWVGIVASELINAGLIR